MSTDINRRIFGWKPDLPDFRDKAYKKLTLEKVAPVALPPSVDLRKTGWMPPVYEQHELGSCTANAIGSAIQYDRARAGLKVWRPSRLFIYYNEREIEGDTQNDTGAMLRDGIKTVARDGYCSETAWPYKEAKFAVQPSRACYNQATKYKALSYFRLDNTNLNELKTCLVASFPFVMGITIYDSFYRADDNRGLVPMPDYNEPALGGHAIKCVGYNDDAKVFIIKNSWGTDGAGDNGYYYMPYDYVTNPDLTDDFWTIRAVS